MILSQPELREAVAKGEIRFDPPLEERQWHEASVDLRLGLKFTKLTAKKGLKFSLAHGFPALVGTDLHDRRLGPSHAAAARATALAMTATALSGALSPVHAM